MLIACDCALELSKLNGFKPLKDGSQSGKLFLHNGIGAGKMQGVLVGPPSHSHGARWEYVIMGDPIRQLAEAEAEASAGETLVSPEAWSLVASEADGAVLRSRNVKLHSIKAMAGKEQDRFRRGKELYRAVRPAILRSLCGTKAEEEETVRKLQPFIPGAVAKQFAEIEGGQIQQAWAGSVRKVSTVFIVIKRADAPHFEDGSVDPEAFLPWLQSVCQTYLQALYRYEGTLSRLQIDDKGIVLKAVFGLPPLTHENDAARAVLTAKCIVDELQRSQIDACAGVATGVIFCGVRPAGTGACASVAI